MPPTRPMTPVVTLPVKTYVNTVPLALVLAFLREHASLGTGGYLLNLRSALLACSRGSLMA
jgi:hypothetical protein